MLCCVKRCYLNVENAMREEPIFSKNCACRCRAPENMMLSSELFHQYFDRDEASMESID